MLTISYWDLLAQKKSALDVFYNSSRYCGGILLTFDDFSGTEQEELYHALMKLKKKIPSILHHDFNTLNNHAYGLQNFDYDIGGYHFFENAHYSHFLRFAFGDEAVPVGHTSSDLEDFRACEKKIVSIFASVMQGLELVFSIPNQKLSQYYDAQTSMLEYNYYPPLQEGMNVARADKEHYEMGQCTRMGTHKDTWPMTLTMPEHCGIDALQFKNIRGHYSNIVFPKNSVLVHYGLNLVEQFADVEHKIIAADHRVLTSSREDRRSNCIIKLVPDEKKLSSTKEDSISDGVASGSARGVLVKEEKDAIILKAFGNDHYVRYKKSDIKNILPITATDSTQSKIVMLVF
ncbi:MAG: hypothetical protein EAY65_06455 [Alphaproteobacteria bacterium]|nr:MAG: hypothetical protein EAY65_06455 [Alphaproteobacteria bacterium]